MLWLASLIGLAGAGAASLVMPQTPTDEEDPYNNDDEYPPESTGFDGTGDLLDFSDDPSVEKDPSPFYLRADFLAQQAAADPMAGSDAPEETPIEDEDPFDIAFAEDVPMTDPDPMQAAPVALGDWVLEGPPAELIEYEAETESLMLVWDDLADGAEEPEVRVEHDPEDMDVKHVVMNDYSIAEVHGDPGLSAEDVTVIPLSSALIVGLEPA